MGKSIEVYSGGRSRSAESIGLYSWGQRSRKAGGRAMIAGRGLSLGARVFTVARQCYLVWHDTDAERDRRVERRVRSRGAQAVAHPDAIRFHPHLQAGPR